MPATDLEKLKIKIVGNGDDVEIDYLPRKASPLFSLVMCLIAIIGCGFFGYLYMGSIYYETVIRVLFNDQTP